MTDQRLVPMAALLLRLSLSFFFFAHLYRKFGSVGFAKWWNGFIKEGYAEWMLAYTVAIEFAGGILLLLGIYSRYVRCWRCRCSRRFACTGRRGAASGSPTAASSSRWLG